MKVDKAIWEVELKKLEDSTCAHWTNKGFKIKEIVSSNATESSSVGRNKTILWSKKYTCHRGPNVYVSKASGNHRPIQKESKKIGCPTCIMVTCYHSNPEFVIFERKNMHSHVPGSYADLKFMSLSDALRRKIKAFLQYGFSRREIRSCLLQEIDEGAEERDKLFHYDDVYNIWLSVAKDMFKFKENEFVIHIYKETQKEYAHLHFGTMAESMKPALTKGEAVLYNTIVTSISSEDVPRKRVLCKCQPLAASINQQTHTEPTTTTISTSTSTSTPTELRSDGPTTTELVLAEDKSEAAWRTSLKRSIEALEVDLKQKEREAHAIKKKIKILKEQL
ncbi:hypothetical protein G6F51_005535 [Rhizopus arrhizus]|uniref:FAR1 domain-containing protein n=1 Tax=Rhizopus oryzae TaxID=64495 RepID=A0A9P7CB96_RHIOR|nr:hypothetical protein G6F51_005535 [Rhizopus arrhizus]